MAITSWQKSVFRGTDGFCEDNKSASKYLNLHTLCSHDKTIQNYTLGMKGENTLLTFTIFIKNISLFKKTKIISLSSFFIPSFFLSCVICLKWTLFSRGKHLYFKEENYGLPLAEGQVWGDT